MNRITVVSFAAVVSVAEAFGAKVITVEPGENALQAAVEQVRKLTNSQRKDGVEIVLRPGIYRTSGIRLEKRDSGREGAPVVWKAEKPGTVKIVTYTAVDGASFSEWTNGIFVAPLPKGVNLGRILDREWHTNELRHIDVPQLMVNGKMMTPATWPNAGWTNIVRFIDEGYRTSNGNIPIAGKGARRGGTFVYSGDRPARWADERDYWLEGYWCYDWSMSDIQVESINTASNTITLAAPHCYGLRQGNPSPRRWRARHVKAELDAPGEYYVDAREGRVYLIPPEGVDLGTADISISGCEAKGVYILCAHDIRFENLTFGEAWTWQMMIRYSQRIEVKDCIFTGGHEKALALMGSSGCRVTGCDFIDMGTGGILTGEDDTRTLRPSGNLIEDCLFRRCSLLALTGAPAVRGQNCVGTTVRHCEITDQPHVGVMINGNDCIYEYNVMSNVCYAADDAAAYYCGRRPACRGNEVRHCLFKDLHTKLSKAGMCGIYLDDGQMGHYVHHSVFVNAGQTSVGPKGKLGHTGAMYTNAGFSNRCENCIFVDCQQAFGCFLQTEKQWARELDKGINSNGDYWQLRHLGGLAFFTNALYIAKYPELKDYLEVYRPVSMRENTARNNVIIDCVRRGNPEHGGWDLNGTNIVLDRKEDPGFVDRANGNYALKPDSVIYRKLPYFTPIEFGKIGLLRRR